MIQAIFHPESTSAILFTMVLLKTLSPDYNVFKILKPGYLAKLKRETTIVQSLEHNIASLSTAESGSKSYALPIKPCMVASISDLPSPYLTSLSLRSSNKTYHHHLPLTSPEDPLGPQTRPTTIISPHLAP